MKKLNDSQKSKMCICIIVTLTIGLIVSTIKLKKVNSQLHALRRTLSYDIYQELDVFVKTFEEIKIIATKLISDPTPNYNELKDETLKLYWKGDSFYDVYLYLDFNHADVDSIPTMRIIENITYLCNKGHITNDENNYLKDVIAYSDYIITNLKPIEYDSYDSDKYMVIDDIFKYNIMSEAKDLRFFNFAKELDKYTRRTTPKVFDILYEFENISYNDVEIDNSKGEEIAKNYANILFGIDKSEINYVYDPQYNHSNCEIQKDDAKYLISSSNGYVYINNLKDTPKKTERITIEELENIAKGYVNKLDSENYLYQGYDDYMQYDYIQFYFSYYKDGIYDNEKFISVVLLTNGDFQRIEVSRLGQYDELRKVPLSEEDILNSIQDDTKNHVEEVKLIYEYNKYIYEVTLNIKGSYTYVWIDGDTGKIFDYSNKSLVDMSYR